MQTEHKMVSARPRRDNTLWQRSMKRALPKFVASRLFVLRNQTEQAVLFVRYSGGAENSVGERQQIPQPFKLERRSAGGHKRLDESARDRIVIVDATITEVTDPESVLH